ncbi:MAG: molybdopterin-dependent oxidoreductase [Proteobacteria bacterium]|nr:molybdopterin-dependent oxidoreductase [Pseudomonadota bacterium]
MADNVETRLVRTACPAHCGIDACGILAHVKGDRIVKLEPAEFPNPADRRICLRGLSSLEITYHADRLKYPMKRVGKRGEGKFERISWDEAFDTIVEKFKKIADEYGWRSIGWAPGGPGAGTTKFGGYLRLASLTQSTRVSAWGYGDSGMPCGSRVLFGTHTPFTLLTTQLPNSSTEGGLVIAWGTNPAESQPLNLMRQVMNAKEQGARLVVVDPRFTDTAAKADEYIGLKPGTDAALALGVMDVIFKRNLHKVEYIAKQTNGPFLVRKDTGKLLRGTDADIGDRNDYIVWDQNLGSAESSKSPGLVPAITGTYTVNGIECQPSFQLLLDLAGEYSPQKTSAITGISADLVAKFGEAVGTAKATTFLTHMGLSRTYHGDISMRALGTLAAVTGNVNSTFGSGHRPAMLNWKPFLHTIPDKPSYSRLGILHLYEAAISGKPFQVKAVFFAFLNFLNQCVNSNKIIDELFPKLDLIVVADLFMTSTARYADILLPAASYLEFSDLLPFPYPYVQLQQKVIEPLYECKSDVDIASELGRRLGFGEYFSQGEEGFIDILLDPANSSMKGITREKLKEGAMPLEFVDLGKDKIDIPYSTPSGKIEIYAENLYEAGQALPGFLPPLESPLETKKTKYPLAYVQGHHRFRHHSSFANVDSLLKLNPEPQVEINPIDAKARDIADDEMVTVFNDRGRATLKAKLTEAVNPGTINIYQGWWFEQFKEGGFNALTHDTVNPVQAAVFEPNMHMNDNAVEVVKYKEVPE